MTSHEHAEIMCAMNNFYSSAIETLRRELVSYGAVMSNIGDVVHTERIKIAVIVKAIITVVESTKEDPTTKLDEPTTTPAINNSNPIIPSATEANIIIITPGTTTPNDAITTYSTDTTKSTNNGITKLVIDKATTPNY